ncbi:MAG: transcription termination factor Rho [Syntrophobacteraceae bacterium]
MAKEKAEKEKQLEEMTAKDLRAKALEVEGLTGVKNMNREEMIAAVKKSQGLPESKPKKGAVPMRDMKAKLHELRAQKQEAKGGENRKLVDALRRKISRLKKKTRKTA